MSNTKQLLLAWILYASDNKDVLAYNIGYFNPGEDSGGWVDGVLAGTVALAFASPQNQQHRAEVVKLLVHPGGRRSGLARRLMLRLEHEAAKAGRSLLVLDTRGGDRADANRAHQRAKDLRTLVELLARDERKEGGIGAAEREESEVRSSVASTASLKRA